MNCSHLVMGKAIFWTAPEENEFWNEPGSENEPKARPCLIESIYVSAISYFGQL